MKKKVALITGITGQDGSYLAEFLIEKGYIVHGIKRRSSSINTNRIDHIYQHPHVKKKNFILHYGDLTDSLSITKIIKNTYPDEIYNLGAQSHVAVSFELPEYTANTNALGALRILEAIRFLKLEKKTKFYQASTSELFGKTTSKSQNENTKFYPRSPYAVSKIFAYWITVNYREAFNIYACNGILFNHESPRRGETFVTRKITIAFSKIFLGLEKILYIGNLDALRDWGHAKDYAKMQWLMLQQKKPKDYVISTNKQYSVRKFIEIAAKTIGIEISWKGKGLNEVGYIKDFIGKKNAFLKQGQIIIKVDKKYYRPSEVDNLLGNSNLAKKELNWKSTINLKSMIKEMIDSDIKILKINSN